MFWKTQDEWLNRNFMGDKIMIHVENALESLREKDPALMAHLGEVRMHLDRFNSQRF